MTGVVFRRQKAVVQVHTVLRHQPCCLLLAGPCECMWHLVQLIHGWQVSCWWVALVCLKSQERVSVSGGQLQKPWALGPFKRVQRKIFVTVVKWQIQRMSGACRVADNSNATVYTRVSTPNVDTSHPRYSSYLGRVVLPICPKHSKVTIQTDRNDTWLKEHRV